MGRCVSRGPRGWSRALTTPTSLRNELSQIFLSASQAMNTIALWITEVTRMSKKRICIAGVDDSGRSFRPIARGFDWTEAHIQSAHFAVGNQIAFERTGDKSEFDYPHSTENVVVHPQTRLVALGDAVALAQRLVPRARFSVADIFAGHADAGNRWVEPGTSCPSLGGMVVARGQCQLTLSFDKLRAILPAVPKGLPVTDLALGERLKTQGWASIQQWLGNGRKVYLRIGLSHPWAKKGPPRCWIQVNAITPIP